MTTAVVAEKPSVARDLAGVLGASQRGEGHFHGNGYVVTWAIGHLVALALPPQMRPDWKRWDLAQLPMIPERWPLVILEGTRRQFEVVQRILANRAVEQVVCATDAGREGELIFRYIYDAAECRKPVRRLWISSLTPDAIREGFRRIRDGAEYDRLADAARGRSRADWLVGMNLSRAYSLVTGLDLSVGRVQTPTLAIVVERELAIRSFVPEDYLEVVATFSPKREGAVNEEREQTLNQLLVEMDGFAPGSGLVIMAATNRPEILDRAFVRAGRFDRQVLVDRPDLRGREAIVRVHARNVKLAPGVDLMLVARRTPGMVGADLANVVNEAALASVRRDATAVTDGDFEEAMDRLQLGLKKAGLVMTDDEKRRVAFHEAGHALVALSVPHADPVHRVTIIPRSIGALGVTLQLPTDERYVLTREELEDRLCVLLGGRSAEEIACGTISTGAQDDLERATAIARQMVCRFGMSDALGPLTWGHNDGLRLVRGQEVVERDYSEETARAIDAEVRRIVEVSHTRAAGLLGARRVALDAIGRALLVRETLERVELEALAGTPRRLVTVAVA